MNILVTGGLGFLGRNLINSLIGEGHKIIALHRRLNSSNLYKQNKIKWVDFNYLNTKFDSLKIDAVFHLATSYGKNENVSKTLESNLLLPIKILELAIEHKCKLFINTDSYFSKKQFQYMHMRSYIDTKNDFVKWANIVIQNSTNFKFVNFRIEHLYGPNDNDDKFVPTILKKLANSENIELTKGGQLRDFIFVTDVVEAYKSILESLVEIPIGFSEVGVGTGISTSIYHFVTQAKTLLNSKSKLFFGALEYRKGEIMCSVANNTSLISYGWQPNYTLIKGLEVIIEEDYSLK